MPAGVCTPNACTACSQRQKSQAAQQVTWIHSGGGGPSGQVFGPRPVCSYGVARVLVPGLLSGARQLWFFVSSSTGEFPPPQKALSHGICAPPPLHNSRVIAPFRVDLLWRVHHDLIRAQARWAGTFLTPAHPTNELNFGNLNERDASREFFFISSAVMFTWERWPWVCWVAYVYTTGPIAVTVGDQRSRLLQNIYLFFWLRAPISFSAVTIII